MKSNLNLLLVIVICTVALCSTIKLMGPFAGRPEWEYQVATGSLSDGAWLKGFGEKGWELVESIGEGDRQNERAFVFKRKK